MALNHKEESENSSISSSSTTLGPSASQPAVPTTTIEGEETALEFRELIQELQADAAFDTADNIAEGTTARVQDAEIEEVQQGKQDLLLENLFHYPSGSETLSAFRKVMMEYCKKAEEGLEAEAEQQDRENQNEGLD